MMRIQLWLLIGTLFFAACTSPARPDDIEQAETPFDEIDSLAVPSPVTDGRSEPTPNRVDPTTVIEEDLLNRRIITDEEYSFPSLIPFDGIRPIYEPVFVTANEATYQDDELVMGVAFDGEAKAYPVTVLRFHEMVNDELAGIPILVTW